jgi:DNA-binding LacI/PurR family transcriptional regulator
MSKRISPPSAHDVARVAGVSQAAVSRAFTPGASIAKATQAKVFEAAKALGYRPNLHARSLISGKSGIVGVVLGKALNAVVMAVLDALSARLSRADKHILVFTAEGNGAADSYVEDLLKYRVDALLLMAIGISPGMARQCKDAGVPLISFNRQMRRHRGLFSVSGDDAEGARRVAGHLLAQGYRRPALMAGFAESATCRERELAFTACLSSSGLNPPEREAGQCQRDCAIQAARLLLKRKPRPDAIFCATDNMALAAIEVARYEFGLEVGRELGIAGFDDIEEAAWPSFDLTSYSLPVDAIVSKAVEIVLSEATADGPAQVTVNGELKPRGSTLRRAK